VQTQTIDVGNDRWPRPSFPPTALNVLIDIDIDLDKVLSHEAVFNPSSIHVALCSGSFDPEDGGN